MTTYEKSFKEEAVRLSEEIGVKLAASQLGIPYWTLADWRAARKARGNQAFIGSGHRFLPTDEKERQIYELKNPVSNLYFRIFIQTSKTLFQFLGHAVF